MDIKIKKPTDKIKAMLSKLNAIPAEVKKEAKVSIATSPSHITIPSKPVKTYEAEYKEAIATNKYLLSKIKLIEKAVEVREKSIETAIGILSSDKNKIDPSLFTIQVEIPKEGHLKLGNAPDSNRKVNVGQPDKIHSALGSTEKLGKCPHYIIRFLGSFPDRAFSKAQIGVATGYSPNSGGFNNALAELNTKGLIIKEGSKIKAGDVSAILGPEFVPQQYSIHTYASKLPKCEREIYETLLLNPELSYGKEQLADATPSKYSPNSGGFNNALSSLNTLELIERSGGQIKLNPELLELL